MLILDELDTEDLQKALGDLKSDILSQYNSLIEEGVDFPDWDKYEEDEDPKTELLLSLNSMKCELEEFDGNEDDREGLEFIITELYISISHTKDFKSNASKWLSHFDHGWI